MGGRGDVGSKRMRGCRKVRDARVKWEDCAVEGREGTKGEGIEVFREG